MPGSLAGGAAIRRVTSRTLKSEVKCVGTVVVPWVLGWGGDEGCGDDWVGMGFSC